MRGTSNDDWRVRVPKRLRQRDRLPQQHAAPILPLDTPFLQPMLNCSQNPPSLHPGKKNKAAESLLCCCLQFPMHTQQGMAKKHRSACEPFATTVPGAEQGLGTTGRAGSRSAGWALAPGTAGGATPFLREEWDRVNSSSFVPGNLSTPVLPCLVTFSQGGSAEKQVKSRKSEGFGV